MPVEAPAPIELGLVQFMAQRLRDPDYKLFEPAQYADYLWATVTCTNRTTRTARLHDTQIYRYPTDGCDPGSSFWRVRITTETALEEYRVNESTGIIFAVNNIEARSSFTITGSIVNVDFALASALQTLEAEPSLAAEYLASNGFVVDSRDAASAIRRLKHEILGVR